MGFPEVGIKIILDKTGWGGPFNSTLREAQKIDKVFAQTAKSVQSSGGKMAKTMLELFESSKFLSDMKNQLPVEAFKEMSAVLDSIWRDQGKRPIDVGIFDAGAYKDMEGAFEAATGGAKTLSNNIDILGFSISKGALAAAGAAAAFAILFKVVKQGVEDYQELGNEVRLLRLEIGGTSNEAAAWLRIQERAGVSTRSFATVMGMLEKNLVDTELRMAEGLESTTQFTRAMSTLRVDAIDPLTGNMRDAGDIMEDLAIKFTEMGPGAGSSGLALALFGRSGRQILPLLFEIGRGLEQAKEDAVRLGIEMSSLDEEITTQARIVSTDLKTAWRGISVLIGREVTPAVTGLKKEMADLLVNARYVAIWVLAMGKAQKEMGLFSPDWKPAFEEEVVRLLGLGTEASRAAEELKIAQDKAAGAAVIHAQKLDILNDKLKESRQELNDLADTFNDRRADLVLQFGEPGELGGRRWDDILLQRSRALEDWYTQDFRKRRDAYISWTQKQEDIFRRHARREIDVTKEGKDKLEEFEKDANKRREDLAREHGRRLRDINQEYLDTVQEAARRNDAVGVVRAMRERAKGIRDEGTKYRDEQEDLRRSLDEKLDEIKKSNEEQKQALRDNLAEQLEDLEISLKRQQDAYLRNLDDQRADRATAYRREEEDFNRTKQRQFDDLNAWYNKEKAALETHMAEMTAAAVAQIGLAAAPLAEAGVNAMAKISGAMIAEIQRQQRLLLQRDYTGMYTAPAPPSHLRAEGGMDIVSGPTSFTFGEGGSPEAILSVPLRGQVTHSHQFSPLKVGLEGVPAGTNPQQMQSMMWQMMVDMIKQVG